MERIKIRINQSIMRYFLNKQTFVFKRNGGIWAKKTKKFLKKTGKWLTVVKSGDIMNTSITGEREGVFFQRKVQQPVGR